ncbi:MAG: hypothetical protein QM811_18020 [Pirellulales bacterium]
MAILDCLIEDASGVMPLYREIIARTAFYPEIDPLFVLLKMMCDEGLLIAHYPPDITIDEAIGRYKLILPNATLAEMSADALGVVFLPTNLGCAEHDKWRNRFIG